MDADCDPTFNPTEVVVIRDAWFGRADQSSDYFGLYVDVEHSGGSQRVISISSMGLLGDSKWRPLEKQVTAAQTFLQICRFMYRAKVISTQDLVGKKLELEMYGGNCVRAFRLLK